MCVFATDLDVCYPEVRMSRQAADCHLSRSFLASLQPQRHRRRCSVSSMSNWSLCILSALDIKPARFLEYDISVLCKRPWSRIFFPACGQTDFLFSFLNKPEKQTATLREERKFHMTYSHGAERLRTHNFYSNMNNIKTFTPLWLNKCPRLKVCLSESLLWHTF